MKIQTQLFFCAAAALAVAGCNPKPTPEASAPPRAAESPPPAAAASPEDAASKRPGRVQNFAASDANDTGPCAEPGMGMGMARGAEHAMGMARGAGHGMGMGPGAGAGAGMGAGCGGGPRCEAHFARFDTNGDGNVSEAEFTSAPHPHGDAPALFAARDQNHDRLLTKAEFCAPWSAPNPPPAPR